LVNVRSSYDREEQRKGDEQFSYLTNQKMPDEEIVVQTCPHQI
jgi:hypothetical protein